MVLGDMATGEAVQVNLDPQPLWQTSWNFGWSGFGMNGNLIINPSWGEGPWVQSLYLSSNSSSAQGGNGEITQPAQVSSGLSVLSYQAATIAQKKILQAMQVVDQAQGRAGAVIDRLDLAGSVASVEGRATAAARAGIADTSAAPAVTSLAAAQARQEVGAAMLVTTEKLPKSLLRLLSGNKAPGG